MTFSMCEMKFEVINPKTLKPFTHEGLEALGWKLKIIGCDVDQFYIGEDGRIILVDDCGNTATIDPCSVFVRPEEEKISYFDSIKRMDLEELASFIVDASPTCPCTVCEYAGTDRCINRRDVCLAGVKKWIMRRKE